MAVEQNISISIDGQTLACQLGQTVIEVADAAGIYIPRFCYHPKLSVAANCRMCLVEVEKAPKPLPACATPVAEGMVVHTRSKRALQAQQDIMSFLLINHPLDCPVCDQGGECELQDLAMTYGRSHGVYDQAKRAVEDEDLGPLVATEMTRCIHCTRCVRFGEEVAGMPELGVMNRGGKAFIGTYLNRKMRSELSGNVIDLCPVGALTAKPSRYRGRSWTFKQRPQIAPHDCVGSNVYVHVHSKHMNNQNEIMRVLPRENQAINEVWISDRDRFSYEGQKHNRLLAPQIKVNGQWQICSWQQVMDRVTDRLMGIVETSGAQHIAGILSSNATVEEGFLFQAWLRSLGVKNIDCRFRQTTETLNCSYPAVPGIQRSIAAISEVTSLLLIEAFPRRHQPMLNHAIRKAALAGASVWSIGSQKQQANYPLSLDYSCPVNQLVHQLAGLVKQLSAHDQENVPKALIDALANAIVTPEIEVLAKALKQSDKPMILLGEAALRHPMADQVLAWAQCLARCCGVGLEYLTEGSNTAGLHLAGCLPNLGPGGVALPANEVGLSARTALSAGMKAYVIHDVAVESDTMSAAQGLSLLNQAAFNVWVSPFDNAEARSWADVMLPCATAYETVGTRVNVAGDWQTVPAAIAADESVRPAWKIYAALLAWQQIDNNMPFDQIDHVTQTVKHAHQVAQSQSLHAQPDTIPKSLAVFESSLWVVMHWHDYREDNLVRHAPALQAQISDVNHVRCHPKTAKKLGVTVAQKVHMKQSLAELTLPCCFDENIAEDTLYVAMAYHDTAAIGLKTGEVTVEVVQ